MAMGGLIADAWGWRAAFLVAGAPGLLMAIVAAVTLIEPRKRLGAAVAPKEIDFVDSLPHTRSGKIMRRLLKARELGLAEGDTSTLETPSGTLESPATEAKS